MVTESEKDDRFYVEQIIYEVNDIDLTKLASSRWPHTTTMIA